MLKQLTVNDLVSIQILHLLYIKHVEIFSDMCSFCSSCSLNISNKYFVCCYFLFFFVIFFVVLLCVKHFLPSVLSHMLFSFSFRCLQRLLWSSSSSSDSIFSTSVPGQYMLVVSESIVRVITHS